MRLEEYTGDSNIIYVSIHASVKDATLVLCVPGYIPKVSIHASVKDATTFCHIPCCIQISFNPRIRKGCDVAATTKSGTPASFNPRIRKGCDIIFLS